MYEIIYTHLSLLPQGLKFTFTFFSITLIVAFIFILLSNRSNEFLYVFTPCKFIIYLCLFRKFIELVISIKIGKSGFSIVLALFSLFMLLWIFLNIFDILGAIIWGILTVFAVLHYSQFELYYKPIIILIILFGIRKTLELNYVKIVIYFVFALVLQILLHFDLLFTLEAILTLELLCRAIYKKKILGIIYLIFATFTTICLVFLSYEYIHSYWFFAIICFIVYLLLR